MGGPCISSLWRPSTWMHLTREGGLQWEWLLIPLTAALFPATLPPPPQGKCQPPLPGRGAARVGSLGPPPAGPSCRPPSCLHVTVKMQSIPAILITGRCISQQPARTKEQQTKNYFSTCLQLLPPFPLKSAFNHWLPGLEKHSRYVQSLLEFVDVTSRSFIPLNTWGRGSFDYLQAVWKVTGDIPTRLAKTILGTPWYTHWKFGYKTEFSV